MIAKKSNKADLERKRFAFFQIGLVVAGSLTLAAFEYTTVNVEKKKVEIAQNTSTWSPTTDLIDEDILESKPQPQTASYQTEPVDSVIISTTPGPLVTTIGPIVIVDTPCIDCIEKPVIVDDTKAKILNFVDKDPEYVGGVEAMMAFLQENTNYPEMCREMGIGGTVFVEFVVNTDGSICQVKSANEMNPLLMKEAERVVGLMPNWIPGENAGKKVRVRYTIPINFVVR